MKFKKRNIQIVDHSTGQTLDFPTFGKQAGEEAINELEQNVDNKIAELKSLVGTPLKASTASAMNNRDKIYVYTGNETGYTNGHWYYYDGTNWSDGGVYNSSAVNTDKTLSMEDMPADAKKTGDEISELKEDTTQLKSELTAILITNWQSGYIKVSASPVTLTAISHAELRYVVIDCTEGDIFVLSGKGGKANSANFVTWIDSENNIITHNSYDTDYQYAKYVAPYGAVKLIINDLAYRPCYIGYNANYIGNYMIDAFLLTNSIITENQLTWESGNIVNGVETSASNRLRTTSIVFAGKGSSIKANAPFVFSVKHYKSNGEYVDDTVLNADDYVSTADEYIRIVVGNRYGDLNLSDGNKCITAILVSESAKFSVGYSDITDLYIGYINTAVNVGQLVPYFVEQNNAYVTQTIPCTSGDKFKITSWGGNDPRSWAFLDNDRLLVNVSEASARCKDLILTAPADGFLVFNSSVNGGSNYVPKIEKYQMLTGGSIGTNFSKIEQIIGDKTKRKYLISPNIPRDYIKYENLLYNPTSLMSYTDIISAYDSLVAAYPSYITKTTLGKDESGTFDIYRYDFTRHVMPYSGRDYNSVYRTDAPTVYIDACMHGSERPCALALLNFMASIASAYDDNGVLGWLRSNVNFVVIPVLNPYGYENNTRWNVNHVDINRNFTEYWGNGSSDVSSNNYRGSAPLSEKETQYVDSILVTDKPDCYINLHTHGVFTGYDKMFSCDIGYEYDDIVQQVAFGTISEVTKSGWKNHNLSANSGYVGVIQFSIPDGAKVTLQMQKYDMAIVTPECTYRYYDGNTSAVYDTKTNCLNAEFVANIAFKLITSIVH